MRVRGLTWAPDEEADDGLKAAPISENASASGLRSAGSGRSMRARTSGAETHPLSHVQATKSSFESIASATALARARSVSVCSAGR